MINKKPRTTVGAMTLVRTPFMTQCKSCTAVSEARDQVWTRETQVEHPDGKVDHLQTFYCKLCGDNIGRMEQAERERERHGDGKFIRVANPGDAETKPDKGENPDISVVETASAAVTEPMPQEEDDEL